MDIYKFRLMAPVLVLVILLFNFSQQVSANSTRDKYKSRCDAGSLSSCVTLGRLYRFTPQDLELSAELFKKACDNNHSDGCYFLGTSYGSGAGVPRDNTKYKHFIQKACSAGHKEACNHLSLFAKSDDVESKSNQERCHDGDLWACESESIAYRMGWNGKKDEKKSFEYAKRACTTNAIFTCGHLALIYYRGLVGAKANVGLARRMYENICDAKIPAGAKKRDDMKHSKQGACEKLVEIGLSDNLISGGEAPLRFDSIQAALDILMLENSGSRASDENIRECWDGCPIALTFGVVKARWELQKVKGCTARKADHAICTFTYRVRSQTSLLSNSEFRNRFVRGLSGAESTELTRSLYFRNGRWRLESI